MFDDRRRSRSRSRDRDESEVPSLPNTVGMTAEQIANLPMFSSAGGVSGSVGFGFLGIKMHQDGLLLIRFCACLLCPDPAILISPRHLTDFDQMCTNYRRPRRRSIVSFLWEIHLRELAKCCCFNF